MATMRGYTFSVRPFIGAHFFIFEGRKEMYLTFDNNSEWFCDNCNDYLNGQPGFSFLSGTWKCTECGALNDVSPKNIIVFDGPG